MNNLCVGQCPQCDSQNTTCEMFETLGDSKIYVPWRCFECGATWEEIFTLATKKETGYGSSRK